MNKIRGLALAVLLLIWLAGWASWVTSYHYTLVTEFFAWLK
ncbi:hypothetical protein [Vibrio phage vB_VmeM-Yong XC32]|nr:hypothetical protein [Vibrio phage vB_VmeM-Yong XC31]QAX96415.1 hypothetical protein [Vibrio phage vB_VmeM-Yong XC32]QAX96732.1 hypothetical protein [Vibrio phage vB_VmeM-Yong MS31]QAX97051.1 hypothetical protein [Vibrio phage vB_VmeM-Yong MS32]